LLIQLACLGFTTHTLGETGRVTANVALLVGIVLGTLFRFWSYRKWVWRAPVIEVLEHEAGAGEVTDSAARG
jgi:putative flippase GtrA